MARNKLVFAGLQEDDVYPQNESFLVGYDLDVVPPPAWLHLEHPTLGTVVPQGSDTLTVRFHAMMSDTTTRARIKIYSNDLAQPVTEIPVTIDMLENSITALGDDARRPSGIMLRQNYPNPFNPVTHVEFAIRNPQKVILAVYDLLGREVKTLVNENKSPGAYTVTWDGTDDRGRAVVSGVYLYRLVAGDPSTGSRQRFMQSRKMLLLR